MIKELTFEEIEAGYVYKLKNKENNKYKPYEYVKVIGKDYADLDHSGNEVPIIIYEFINEHGEVQVSNASAGEFVERQPHCHTCGKALYESEMKSCDKCGWIICSDDNSCGCNYKKA